MKKLVYLLSTLSIASFAGKLEREYLKTKLDPAVAKAQLDLKKACGCDWKISYNAQGKSADQLSPLFYTVEKISEQAPAYCSDEESKKAVCKINTVKVEFGTETKHKIEGTTAHLISDGQSFITFDVLAEALDK